MTDISKAKRQEIEKNFKAIQKEMDRYIPLRANRYALMRHGDVVEFYVSYEDAYKTGRRFYEDGLFSIQKVTKTPEDLGYFSRAVHIR